MKRQVDGAVRRGMGMAVVWALATYGLIVLLLQLIAALVVD